MSGSMEHDATGEATRGKTRQGVEQGEKGDPSGMDLIDAAREVDPADPTETEAIEQETSDGPPGRGLAR